MKGQIRLARRQASSPRSSRAGQNLAFDFRLGKHGGTKYRDSRTGRLAANLNRGKPWYCPRSPVGAHHWLIVGHVGRCKYCSEERDFKLPKE